MLSTVSLTAGNHCVQHNYQQPTHSLGEFSGGVMSGRRIVWGKSFREVLEEKCPAVCPGGEFPGIGVARGLQWMHLHPQGGEKNFFRPNLQGKCVSAPAGHEVHPQPEQESIFRTVFAGRVRFGGYLDGL